MIFTVKLLVTFNFEFYVIYKFYNTIGKRFPSDQYPPKIFAKRYKCPGLVFIIRQILRTAASSTGTYGKVTFYECEVNRCF